MSSPSRLFPLSSLGARLSKTVPVRFDGIVPYAKTIGSARLEWIAEEALSDRHAELGIDHSGYFRVVQKHRSTFVVFGVEEVTYAHGD